MELEYLLAWESSGRMGFHLSQPPYLNSLNSSGNSLLSIQAFIPSANSSGHCRFQPCTAPFTTKALLSSQPPLKTCPNLRVPSTSSCRSPATASVLNGSGTPSP